jgi:hypothetical protein
VQLPDAEVGGLDLAAWSTRSWQWFFSWCDYGQSATVFF